MIKVFLVEDEIVIREGIQRMVPWEEYGFELTGEAADGEIALPMIKKIKPDVIITDIKMPFMDGLELTKVIKKELPKTKIIIISGYDDFKYAQQAILLGVERYILKPITKNNFIEVLSDIRDKYEAEHEQQKYYEKFQNEIQVYEQHSRRDFFEALVSGHFHLQNIYDMALKYQIDILAPCYNIILFSMNAANEKEVIGDTYSQKIADLQNQAELLLLNRTDLILFRNQMFSYAILVKGEENTIDKQTKSCVDNLQNLFAEGGHVIDWFICTGKIVNRLSSLPECYKEAMRAFAYRYINGSRVMTYEDISKEYGENADEMVLKHIDTSAVNPDIIRNFLSNALIDEVDSFVDNYFDMIGEQALASRMFRQYIVLNMHFCMISFIQKLGIQKEVIDDELQIFSSDPIDSVNTARAMIKNILAKGIKLRDDSTRSRYKSVIGKAVEYINENYSDEFLTLNKVACAANVSANHFSALFSQEMKQTFIEYLTELRMKKAKEMLRCTDKRSGEIALDIGYKDSHYFSFLFKKTQGCTPSEYRKRKETP